MPNWYIRDTVDLEYPAKTLELAHAQPVQLMMPGDNGAHVWCVTVNIGSEQADLTGQAVQAFFLRPDGNTVAVEGTAIGNVAQVTFPRDVYLYRGTMRAVMRVGDSIESVEDPVTTLVERTFYVRDGVGSNVISPETSYPTIEMLIEKIEHLVDVVYPVGSIFINTTDLNPSTFLTGTTWVRIKDTFLLAAGDTYAAGSTGGEAEHTLTVNEMPAHNHTDTVYANSITTTGDIGYMQPTSQNNYINFRNLTTAGGGQAHNNMPPYLAVYVWQRTA